MDENKQTDTEKDETMNADAPAESGPVSPAPAEPAPAEKKPEAKRSFTAEVFEFFEMFIISAIAVTLLFSFCVRLCNVVGQSMESTLFQGEMLVVSDLFYTPERGDIIVFHNTSEKYPSLNEPIVKRVIATGGEYVSVEVGENRLIVTVWDKNHENPQVLEEDYAQYVDYFVKSSAHDYPVQVPEGFLFVMGDNRNHSSDSRAVQVGFVVERRVLGKVIGNLGESRGCLGGR